MRTAARRPRASWSSPPGRHAHKYNAMHVTYNEELLSAKVEKYNKKKTEAKNSLKLLNVHLDIGAGGC